MNQSESLTTYCLLHSSESPQLIVSVLLEDTRVEHRLPIKGTTSTVPGGRGDTVVPRCSEGCCDIIPSVCTATTSASLGSRGYARTHTRARALVHGRARIAQHRFNRNQSTSESVRRNATWSSIHAALSRARTRTRGNTRGKSTRSPASRWAL